MEARLTISRALMWAMVSCSFRPFARRVLPVSTISTMQSAKFSEGAISMAPVKGMMATWAPLRAKKLRLTFTNLVAVRKPPFFAAR